MLLANVKKRSDSHFVVFACGVLAGVALPLEPLEGGAAPFWPVGFGCFSPISSLVCRPIGAFIHGVYQPILAAALRARYFTISVAIGVMMVTMGLIVGGWIKFQFFPLVEGDNMAQLVGRCRDLAFASRRGQQSRWIA